MSHAAYLSRAESSKPSNEQLVQGVLAGKVASRALLFKTYAVGVQRLLSRKLGQDPELPDLLHDVFIAAFEGIGRLREPQALPVFLKQIAIHVAHGHIRRRMKRRALVNELALAAKGGEALSAPPHGEARASIDNLLSRLPEQERVPFSLRFIGELELTEVALECGLSIPTVKRRLSAAKRRIADLERYAQPNAGP